VLLVDAAHGARTAAQLSALALIHSSGCLATRMGCYSQSTTGVLAARLLAVPSAVQGNAFEGTQASTLHIAELLQKGRHVMKQCIIRNVQNTRRPHHVCSPRPVCAGARSGGT